MAMLKAGTPAANAKVTDKTTGAAPDASVKGTMDLAGSGTQGVCGTGKGVHTPGLKNSMGSFVFTPSLPGQKLHKGTSAVMDFKTGATMGTVSVC